MNPELRPLRTKGVKAADQIAQEVAGEVVETGAGWLQETIDGIDGR